MTLSASLLLGLGLLVAGWWLPRRIAGTSWRLHGVLLLDGLMPALLFVLLLLATGRPLFAGLVCFSLCAGFAYADRSKRQTLDEPIIFTDVFQALDIARHPQLALPFPHKKRVVAGAVAVIAAFILLYVLEAPFCNLSPWFLAGFLASFVVLAWIALGPLGHSSLAFLQNLKATGEPQRDAAVFGPFAMQWIHALLARGERVARRAALAVPAVTTGNLEAHLDQGPVVVVQSESFFDARHLHPSIDRQLLPHFDRLCNSSQQWGRLSVPCWGANTVRTEFAVLSGLAAAALGFDHFNPYHRFADAPLNTLAWQMRARGYRTICLHPFDGRFYGRDRIMANLGFDELIDERHFRADAPRVEGYIADSEVASVASALLREHGPRVFLFVITMENHGPWTHSSGVHDELPAELLLSSDDRRALSRYLRSLRNTDRMLGTLRDTLEQDFDQGTLMFYGDHLPGLRSAFQTLGLSDRRSDYLIWRRQGGASEHVDLAAHQLRSSLLSEQS